MKFHARSMGSTLHLFHEETMSLHGRIEEDTHPGHLGNHLLEQFQPLRAYFRAQGGQSCDIPARPPEVVDEACPTGSETNVMTTGMVLVALCAA